MARTKAQAVAAVDAHVEPKACFVTFVGTAAGWSPLSGTGCAHWVAHQLGIIRGSRGNNACDLGNPIRVRDVVSGRGAIQPADAQVNDIWANTGLTHCGLVATITPAATAGAPPIITITHDSSGQGGVFTNDWATYFHGGGVFYR